MRTIEAGYGLSAIFAPGNRHAVVGTKEGNLDIIDVGASSRLQSIEAHSGAVWSLAALPDNRSVCIHYHYTGSGTVGRIQEEEELHKLWPANKTDHLCQSWQ